MRVGFALGGADGAGAPGSGSAWEAVAARATAAGRAGVHSLWITDAVPSLDPFVALGALAGSVPGVRLGAVLEDVARRPAAVVAKIAATLDVVSGGRVDLALGGEPGHLGEAVEVLRGLFGGGPFTYSGRHLRVVAARCLPRPVQRPGVPVWVAGRDDAALALAASAGDGWFAGAPADPEAFAADLARLAAACRRAGRDPASLARAAVVADGRGDPALRAGAWAAAGVTDLVVDLGPGSRRAGGGDGPGGFEDRLARIVAACSLEEPCQPSDRWN